MESLRLLWSTRKSDRVIFASFVIVIVYFLTAILVQAGLLAGDYAEKAGPVYAAPSWDVVLGTDYLGRSIFLKIVYGIKISMTVGLIACFIAIPIGVVLGAFAGYFRGTIDEIIVWLYSTVDSIPAILLIVAFALAFQNVSLLGFRLEGLTAVYLALGLTSWVGICRLIRGEVIKHKERDYVIAARSFGAGHFRTLFRHILPNVFHFVIIDFSLRFVGAIHMEIILSYLGIGSKNEPSLGVMIADATLELQRDIWWPLLGATLAVFFISLAVNLIGDFLRDHLDPRLEERKL